eukprot:CAMPEP_0168600342 /NCGR_PEP_ID=MMETSP0420-20121227/12715_1 /TAXON_ID=498008 /ORGANISM="Pessonella sp." /LENGTH=777 /DNA_ID=CAMNT_0008638391 /DNA_START=200 /DNA_END=2533 /DNA_ORIENTATION=+
MKIDEEEFELIVRNSNTSEKKNKMSDKTLPFKVSKCTKASLALTNKVFFNPADFEAMDGLRKKKLKDSSQRYVKIEHLIFTYDQDEAIKPGTIGLSGAQRLSCNLALKDVLDLKPYSQKSDNMYISAVHFVVDFFGKKKSTKETYEAAEMAKTLIELFANQFLTVGQQFVADFHNTNISFTVSRIEVADIDSLTTSSSSSAAPKIAAASAERGVLMNSSQISMEKAKDSAINLAGAEGGAVGGAGLLLDWDFEQMGIGGLDDEFNAIFRRAFASRIYPPAVIAKLGITHVRGLLLYGPPGTGKTLMARQIGKMLNGREPVLVSGPEILNKFVGQSEENIRKLFAAAEEEQKARGMDSDLHIIIMDELDAICRARGSTTSSAGVGDTVVNQLLAKMDGVDSLHNILVIGMTNRKELIDPALLRPGRLEVHIEIGLPDGKGRSQILGIHTAKMRESGLLDGTIDLDTLARERMKNYSGAEIEGVVKAAASWAFQRQVNPHNLKEAPNPDDLRITAQDFERALGEIKPAFGVEKDDFSQAVPNGIVNYSPSFAKLMQTCKMFVQQVHHSTRTPRVSVLLEGARGTGKTAVAATLALESDFPFVKLVTPDKLVGLSDAARVDAVVQAFNDASKSPLSVLVLDDFERLIEYVPAQPSRFSNAMLQSLAVLLRRAPPKGRRLLVLCTCASPRALKELQIADAFDAHVIVPSIRNAQEFRTFLTDAHIMAFEGAELEQCVKAFPSDFEIGVKKLIMLLEMAKQGEGKAVDRFCSLLMDYSLSRL